MSQQIYLGERDVPHVGALFRLNREKRCVRGIDVINHVKASHPSASQSGLTAFEADMPTNARSNGNGNGAQPLSAPARAKSSRYFDALVDALRQETLGDTRVSSPLAPESAAMLQRIYDCNHRDGQIVRQELALAAVDFGFIRGPRLPRALQNMRDALYRETRPAFIADSLWFIHAMNGAMLNLFGVDPNDGFLRQWSAWHSLAAKLTPDSPILQAHLGTNQFYPPVIDVFFRATSESLFTVQMRALLAEMHRLSAASGVTHFDRWWEQTITFQLPWEQEQLTRDIKYWGSLPAHGRTESNYTLVRVSAHHETDVVVPSCSGEPIYFWLGTWGAPPLDSRSMSVMENLSGFVPDNREIFYAADFDVDDTFHVNSWPAVAQYLAELEPN